MSAFRPLCRFLLLCLTLAAAAPATSAEPRPPSAVEIPEPAWQIPAGSGWQRSHYLPDSGLLVFSGRQILSGTLKLEWETREDEVLTRLVFRPDDAGRRRMPFVADAYNQNPMDILLNGVNLQTDGSQRPAPSPRRLLARYFSGVPAGILRQPEGRVSRPATITVSRFGMSVECDRRYYYADTAAIRPAGRNRVQPPGENGC